MNISEEKTGELTATLKFEVAESDYAEKYQQELKNYRRQATMPGFRPGNVPMGIIQKKYGIAILLEEVNKFVSEELNNYIKKNNLNLLGYPLPNGEIEPQDFVKQKDFNFYFDIAFAPEIDLNFEDYAPVDYLKIIIDDVKLDEQIENIQKKNGELVEQDTVEKNDMIYVSIKELDEAGTVKEGGISNETMILVNYLKNEDVLDQVLGSKTGDVVIFNPLVATGNEAETASMLGIEKEKASQITSDFQFEITKIERNEPMELGEELYKIVFPKDEIHTEDKFREKVREDFEKAYEIESMRLFSRYAMDNLFDNTKMNLPDDFLKKWLFTSNEGKLSMDAIEKNYNGYQKSIKMELIENNLIKKDNRLRVTDEDIKEEIKKYFRGYFMPDSLNMPEEDEAMSQQLDQIADNYLQKNKEESQRIHDELFSRRLAEFLRKEMKINEREVSYDDFIEEITRLTAHSHDHDHDHGHDHGHDHDHHHDHDHENVQEKE